MLGSVCNPDARVRRKALDHLLACIDVMDATGSRDLKLWFSDGTNYPGQDDIRARQDRLAEALAAVHARLGPDQRMLLEYKLFEPSFYTMDVPDWGTAYIQCVAAGPKAKVVVDTGHHAPGTNIEFIVASLLRGGPPRRVRLQLAVLRRRRPDGRRRPTRSSCSGSCTRSCRAAASTRCRRRVHARPVPQHRAQDPRPDPVGHERPGGDRQGAPRRSPRPWPRRRRAVTCSGANAVLMDAYNTDVRPLLAEVRDRPRPRPRSDRRVCPVGLRRADRRRARRRPAGGLGRMSVESAKPEHEPAGRRRSSSAPTGSARTRGTRTTPAATPRPRASASTR